MENSGVFPWGAYSYLTLRHYVKNLVVHRKMYTLSGLVWAILVWALEVIPDLRSKVGVYVSDTFYPRCRRWMFCSTSAKDLGSIFDDEDAQLMEMLPDDVEMSSHYYRSLTDESALAVVYVAPSNPIRNRQQPPRGEVRPKFHEEPHVSLVY